jgi:hypothetical protein
MIIKRLWLHQYCASHFQPHQASTNRMLGTHKIINLENVTMQVKTMIWNNPNNFVRIICEVIF